MPTLNYLLVVNYSLEKKRRGKEVGQKDIWEGIRMISAGGALLMHLLPLSESPYVNSINPPSNRCGGYYGPILPLRKSEAQGVRIAIDHTAG